MSDYELLDSGIGSKLERFGEKLIVRPSSIAMWRTRSDQKFKKEWTGADATYDPKAQNWRFKSKSFADWTIKLDSFQLKLRLQNNGQIGFFPDHYGYMPELVKQLTTFKNPQLLNLFAYTGMASIVACQNGASVTHIDSSKKCLDWTRANFELNKLSTSNLKLIPEDALLFIKRAARRGLKYQVIIADPPSFYRPDKGRIWHLEQHFHELLAGIMELLDPAGGQLYFTCHSFSLEVLKNLLLDFSTQGLKLLRADELNLCETKSSRKLPAGVFSLSKLSH